MVDFYHFNRRRNNGSENAEHLRQHGEYYADCRSCRKTDKYQSDGTDARDIKRFCFEKSEKRARNYRRRWEDNRLCDYKRGNLPYGNPEQKNADADGNLFRSQTHFISIDL